MFIFKKEYQTNKKKAQNNIQLSPINTTAALSSIVRFKSEDEICWDEVLTIYTK